MVAVTPLEKRKFLSNFDTKVVLFEDKLYYLNGMYSQLATTGKVYGDFNATLKELDSNRTKITKVKNVLPFIREIDSITDNEKSVLKELETSISFLNDSDKIDLMDLNWYQYEYLKSINIDIPLFFGHDHDNNYETAIDLEMALPMSEFSKYQQQLLKSFR